MVEYAINDAKTFGNFMEKLNEEECTSLLKFFYMTYERFTLRQDCGSLKPNKIYKLNHAIVEKFGTKLIYNFLLCILYAFIGFYCFINDNISFNTNANYFRCWKCSESIICYSKIVIYILKEFK